MALLPRLGQAQSAGAAFSCDGTFYLNQQITTGTLDRSTLSRVNRSGTSVSFTQIRDLGAGLVGATTDFVINSLAYNPQDGYLYCLTYPAGNSGFPAVNMYRIGQGGVERVGTTNITINGAMPAQFPQFAAGVFDQSGNYYVAARNIADMQYRNTLFRFTPAGNNVNATTLPLLNATGGVLNPSATYNVGTTKSFIDLVIDPVTNLMYGTYGVNMLYRFDFSTTPGSARVTQLGANPDGTTNIGSAFFDVSGAMYGYANEGGFYTVNTTTGAYSLIETDNTVAVSDGASCINPIQRLDVTKELTGLTQVNATTFDVRYTLRLRNTGTVTATKVQVSDFLRGNTLNTTFPTATAVTVSAAPTVTNLDGSTLAANPAFNGQGTNADLLSGSQSLTAGQRATIVFTARVVFPANNVPATAQNNTAYATAISGPNAANEGYTLLANGTLLPPADLIANDASTDGATMPALRASLNDPGDAPAPTPVLLVATIAGTVFDDVNYGGGAGRSYATANASAVAEGFANNAIRRAGVRVELYNAAGTFVSATTTTAAGAYTFTVTPNVNYTVRVPNNAGSAVSSARAGASSGLLPVQTFVNGNTNRVGGENPALVDAGNGAAGTTLTALTTPTTVAQSITTVNTGLDGAATDVDFGFNFSTIVSTRNAGQGSLRQFITNANALGNENLLAQVYTNAAGITTALGVDRETSIFMVPGPAAVPGLRSGLANALTSGVAVFAPTALLPTITSPSVWIDGSTQTANANTNAGAQGTGGTVGVNATPLGQVNDPEVQITGVNTLNYGLDFGTTAANGGVNGLAIYGFTPTGGYPYAPDYRDTYANIRVASNNVTISNNFVGTTALAFADPGAATRTNLNLITVYGGTGTTISNNLLGYGNSRGVFVAPPNTYTNNVPAGAAATTTGGANVTVTGNEFRQTGLVNNNLDGIDIQAVGQTAATGSTVQNNLFDSNAGPGIDTYQSNGFNLLTNNTITNNGRGTATTAPNETQGIRLWGTTNTVSLNIISGNYGAGIYAVGPQAAAINPVATSRFSQNSIFNNGTVTGLNGAAASGQIGIDLGTTNGNIGVGDAPYVTLNDSGDGDTGANGLLNFPVFQTATVIGTNLVLTGFARPGTLVELFANTAADASGFGEGQTYVGTVTEGGTAGGPNNNLAADANASADAYSGAINGLNQGADNTNRFTFTIPLAALSGVTAGSILTATGTLAGATSEFSGRVVVTAVPVAVNDVTNTPNNTAITFSLTANDTDADGTINTATIDLDPATAGIQTTFTVAGQGTFTTVGVTAGLVRFTPASANFTGVATTPYTVNDNTGLTSNPATISVNVGPLTAHDASTTAYNVATSTTVTANDTDANGINAATVDLDPTTAGRQTTFTVAGQGTFTVDNAGVVTFTPAGAFVGITSVNYVVLDNLTGNAALSAVATYSVTTTNAAPVAVADLATTPSNTAVTFSLLGNDTDTNGNATLNAATIDLNPGVSGIQTTRTVAGQGTFTTVGVPAGSVRFTPATNYTGSATIQYQVQDALGQLSNSAAITVRVGPLATDDAATSNLGQSVRLAGATNDIDSEGLNLASLDLDPTTAGIQTSMTIVGQGTFVVDGATGEVVFAPAAAFTGGVVSTLYVVRDVNGVVSNPALLSVTVAPYTDVITTIDGTQVADAGQPVTYTATTTNNGPNPVYNLVVQVQLPANLLNTDGTPFSVVGATYTPATGVLVYAPVGAVASGQTVTNTFAFRMPNTGTASGRASSTFGTVPDANVANNDGSQSPALVITNGAPLPVELLHFTARASGRTARLTWATASERNSATFVVERSADGYAYTVLGQLDAAGTTAVGQHYTLTDAHPLAGVNYYRLRQLDTDGTARVFNPQTLRFAEGGRGAATLYPVPALADVTLDLSKAAAGTYSVEIFDLAGRLVLPATTLAAGQAHPLAVAALPAGAYVVRLTPLVNGPASASQTLRLIRE